MVLFLLVVFLKMDIISTPMKFTLIRTQTHCVRVGHWCKGGYREARGKVAMGSSTGLTSSNYVAVVHAQKAILSLLAPHLQEQIN